MVFMKKKMAAKTKGSGRAGAYMKSMVGPKLKGRMSSSMAGKAKRR